MQAPVPLVILTGPEHFFILANPPYEELVGRNVIGKNISQVFSPEESKDFLPLLDQVFKTGVPFIGNEMPFHVYEGNKIKTHRWINIGFHPFIDSKGGIKGVLAVVIDVTEQVVTRLKLEEIAKQLNTEKQKLEAIFEKSPAVMALWKGKDLIFEKANPRYKDISSNRELLGRPLLEALPELKGQGFDDLILKVFETGEPFIGREILAKMYDKHGVLQNMYFDFSYVQITDSQGRPYGVYVHALDVTERLLARKALEESKVRLQENVGLLEQEKELRENFVAALTHDLRTPLTAAKMSAQLLLRRSDDQLQIQKLSGRIVDQIERTDLMIRDLLDASSVKAGEPLPLDIKQCKLGNIVQKTIDELTSIHGERFVLKSHQKIAGFWDELALRRVLENLLNNAVKYGQDSSPITITANQENASAKISVHNFGAPLSKEEIENIFRPYRRTGSASKGSQKGWGLGLTLVKGLVEAHGGSVDVISSSETGNDFLINLPLDSRKERHKT